MKVFLVLILLSYSALALELRRETSLPVGDCDTSNYSPALVKATAHVNAIKDRIVAANPDVFRDDLAPSRICAGVNNIRSQRAWAATRSFVVEAGMILRVQNDAQLAYVVAHELAHLTMRHNLDGLPLRNPSDAVKAAKRQLHLLSEEISALDKSSPSHAANFEAVNTRLEAARAIVSNAIISEFGSDFEKNWDEAEAELVGSHLFLRAGFSGEEIGWRVQQLAMAEAAGQDPHSPAPQISSGERISAALRACGTASLAAFTEPPRGGGPYATPCWTIWKLTKDEPAKDAAYRARFNAEGVVNLSVQPGLSEVQAEVRALIPPEALPPKEESEPTSASPVPAKKPETTTTTPEPEAEDAE